MTKKKYLALTISLVCGCNLTSSAVSELPSHFTNRSSGFDCGNELPVGETVSNFKQYTLQEIGPLNESTRIPNREKYLMVVKSPVLECDFYVVDSRSLNASSGRKLRDPKSLLERSLFSNLLQENLRLVDTGATLIVAVEEPEFDLETYLVSPDGVYVDGQVIDDTF